MYFETSKAKPLAETHQSESPNPAIPSNDHFHIPGKTLTEFAKQTLSVEFESVDPSINFSGNYNNYVALALKSIASLQKLDFNLALKDNALSQNISGESVLSRYVNESNISSSSRKILLLDLDETLIHSDFEERYCQSSYDAKISFESDEEIYSVGIFIRNGLKYFLSKVSKEFDIGIFTASCKEYADAVIDHIDPNREYIKFRLYRNNCININNKVNIKDLRVIKGINLEKIVIVDNSMLSFANQLSNGILINSFYNDKDDHELFNVMSYLLTYIVNADDVRKVNEQFFNFAEICQELVNESEMEKM